MKAFALPKVFESINIHRYLRRTYVNRAVEVFKLILLGAIVLVILYLIWTIYSESKNTTEKTENFKNELTKKIESVTQTNTEKEIKRDFNVIHQRNVFGPLGLSNTVKPIPTPAKPIAVTPLTLIGTFISKGQPAYAIVEEGKKKTQDIFNLNDTIFGEAKLTAILPDRVEILRNGQKEILLVDTNSEGGGADTGSSNSGSDEVVVDEAELDKALENLPLLLTQARAVPFFKEGRAVGLRLFAIRAGSLFEKIGLLNGDVLKTVNGNSMADLSQAMQLFQKLKEEKSISLVIERNMADKQIHYQIK